MIRYLFTALLVICCHRSSAQFLNGDPPELRTSRTLVQKLDDQAGIFIDSTNRLPLASIADSLFSPIKSYIEAQRIPRHKTAYNYYYRFRLNSADFDQPGYYLYPGMHYQSLQLYRRSTKGQWEVMQQPAHPDGFLWVTNQAGTSNEFLVKARFNRTEFNILSLKLIQADYLENFRNDMLHFAGTRKMMGFIYSGVLFIMIIYGLIFYAITRKPEYAYNGLYSVCMFGITFIFAYHANVPGYWYSHFVSYFWLLLLDLGTIFYVQFTRKFLPTAKNSFIDKLLKAEMIALSLLIVLYTVLHFYTPWVMLDAFLENAMKFTVVIISFIYIVLGLENKNRLMNYLAIGNAIQVIFAIVALSLLGPSTQTTNLFRSSLFYFESGVIISQIFFFLGLAYKQNRELADSIRFREKMLRNEEKLKYEAQVAILEAQQAERQRISVDMHDDLGAGVTSIRLFSELAKKKLNGQVIPEIDKVSAFANELLVNMNAIIWSMSGQNDQLDNMVAYIRSYALEYGEHAGLNITIDSPDHIPALPIRGEVRRNIFLIVKEALHNVVKHAQATNVSIQFQIEGNSFSLLIQDNGTGIHPEKIRQFGNGLKNMRKRMENIGGNFEISSNQGTTIRLSRSWQTPLQRP